VSLGDPSRRMFDDGAGMHEYLLCTGIVVVPASDPKDFVCGMCNHVNRTKHKANMGRLS
jgi:hypothetical protein